MLNNKVLLFTKFMYKISYVTGFISNVLYTSESLDITSVTDPDPLGSVTFGLPGYGSIQIVHGSGSQFGLFFRILS
jgi:hypothetical protein